MHDFTVLALDGAYPTSVAITRDLMTAATALAGRAGVAAPRWRLCSLDGGLLRLQGGFVVATTRLPAKARQDRSTWIVPGLGVASAADLRHRLSRPDALQAIDGIQRHVRRGGSVAASCSAVFLLQAAGLLDGRRATTTWWLGPFLKRLQPDCMVDADRMVCVDGPILTAGAAFAQSDLVLHLLRECCGPTLVELVSRMLLIETRQAQSHFIVPEAIVDGSDLVARVAARVESSLPNPPTVTELAQEFCMSARTLSRHVRRATGKSTAALLQSIKVRRARSLLETSRMTVDEIAAAVGYQDSTALRRLMRKLVGTNPSRYRPAVGAR